MKEMQILNKTQMDKNNLVNRLKKGLLAGILVGYMGLARCGGGGSVSQPPKPTPPNRLPAITLNISPTSGVSPLEIRIQGQCTDPDGQNDIVNYKVMSESQVLTTTNPTDMKHTLTGSAAISSECSDRAGERATAGPINVQVLQPELSQTVHLVNDVDVDYMATLTNVPSATRTITRDGNQFGSPTIITTSPYTEIFDGMSKGNYSFKLEALGVTPHITSLEVPPYPPEADFSFLVNTNLDDNEGFSKTFNLGLEGILTDKNPEDNPVPLISATTLSGDVAIIRSGYNLTITATGEPGPYEVEVHFGSDAGGRNKKIIQGNVFDLVHLTGQLQDARTNTELKAYESGIIHVYNAADNTLLKEYLTDSQGNFDFKLDQPGISEILLQARIDTETSIGLADGFVRTIKIPGRDTTNILVRAYPYNEILAYAGINRADFRKHLEEINPHLLKSKVDSIEIIDVDPLGRGSFTPEFMDLVKNKILDPNDIGCYVDPVEKGRPLYVQVDDPNSIKHYHIEGNEIIPDQGWGIFVRDTTLQGAYTKTFNEYMFRIATRPATETVAAHEFGHAFIAPWNHALTLLAGTQTIMRDGEAGRSTPGPADCEAGKVIYEQTYELQGEEGIRIEPYDNTLGLGFCDDNSSEFCPKKQ